MLRFILLSFFFLGWAFYELSGGSDFSRELAQKRAEHRREATETTVAAKEPENRVVTPVIAPQNPPASAVPKAMVTRVTFAEQPAPLPIEPASPSTVAANAPPSETKDVLPAASETIPSSPDLRSVRASRANVRNGPGTRYNVVFKLDRGTTIEILQDPGNGWLKLRTQDTERVGWVAASLLGRTGN